MDGIRLDYWKEHNYFTDSSDIIIQDGGKFYRTEFRFISRNHGLSHDLILRKGEEIKNLSCYHDYDVKDEESDWHK